MRHFLGQCLLRTLMATHAFAMAVAKVVHLPRRTATGSQPKTIVLTGMFYSENWIMNHLGPLAASAACSRVKIVCSFPIPETQNVEVVRPWSWLRSIAGETSARLATFAWVCLKTRPDVVGGFHILVNGLVAALVGRIVSARSLYFCGGGPREVIDGGFQSDNRLFSLLKRPDAWLERRLLRAVDQCGIVITMGSRSVKFFQQHGVRTRFEVLPGGIRATSAAASQVNTKDFDLILVGRIVPVKRIDLFLRAIALLRRDLPGVRAAIVGRGEEEDRLKALARDLDLDSAVLFAGFQRNVTEWLARSRVFVLTSDSEGLSLALMEAMTAGLPCVVSDVGELGEIVESGVNGFLVQERTPEAFAEALLPILAETDRQRAMSAAAVQTASRFEFSEAVRRWDTILRSI